MTDARLGGFWHRSGLLAASAMLVTAAANEGCGGDGPAQTTSTSSSTTTTTTTTGTGGGGGTGGTGGTGGVGGGMQANIAAAAEDIARPLDATPDPDGENIYFSALDPTKGAGIYKAGSGGAATSVVRAGDPYASPFGVSMGSDGKLLYVADLGAGEDLNNDNVVDSGQIFVQSVSGGDPSVLMGTVGTKPRGLEVVQEKGVDQVYFSGRDDKGLFGVFKIPATGGAPTAVSVGAPFVDPSGIAVATSGDVYVADAASATAFGAVIYKIAAGQNVAKELVVVPQIGYPAGIALDAENAQLLISALDPLKQTDVVIIVDLATGNLSTYTGDADTDISKFQESAGLHRAKNKNVFAWADSTAGKAGIVFKINF
jgi:hypothetical protein